MVYNLITSLAAPLDHVSKLILYLDVIVISYNYILLSSKETRRQSEGRENKIT